MFGSGGASPATPPIYSEEAPEQRRQRLVHTGRAGRVCRGPEQQAVENQNQNRRSPKNRVMIPRLWSHLCHLRDTPPSEGLHFPIY